MAYKQGSFPNSLTSGLSPSLSFSLFSLRFHLALGLTARRAIIRR